MWRLKLLDTIEFVTKTIIILVGGTGIIISLLEIYVLWNYTGR